MHLMPRNIRKLSLQDIFLSSKSLHRTTNLTSGSSIKERPDQRIACTLIPGDGVGPELSQSVQEVFKSCGIPVDFHVYFLSEVNPKASTPLGVVVDSIQKNRVCLKGVLASPIDSCTGDLQNLDMKLRKALDLYANVVHVKSLPGVKSKHDDIDCIIIREQTEGEYSALEHEGVKGVVESLKIVTAKQSLRIARFAFDYATQHERKKVTAVHKANIMKLGDGLFLKSCEDVAKLYPKIKFEKIIVDNCSMQMVSKPQQFDVIVTTNLYGSIMDNLGCGLVGGAGVIAGASYSANLVVFEPGTRHPYSKAAGKNVANPAAMLLAASKMLRHINLSLYGAMLEHAVQKVLLDGKVRTKDLGGQASTQEFSYAVINNLELLRKGPAL
nr:unnamed protein product [Callosobruchus analis]